MKVKFGSPYSTRKKRNSDFLVPHGEARKITYVQYNKQYFGIYSGLNRNFDSRANKNYIRIKIIVHFSNFYILHNKK